MQVKCMHTGQVYAYRSSICIQVKCMHTGKVMHTGQVIHTGQVYA